MIPTVLIICSPLAVLFIMEVDERLFETIDAVNQRWVDKVTKRKETEEATMSNRGICKKSDCAALTSAEIGVLDAAGQDDGAEDDPEEEEAADESLPDVPRRDVHDALLGGPGGSDEPEGDGADEVQVQDLDVRDRRVELLEQHTRQLEQHTHQLEQRLQLLEAKNAAL